VFGRFRYILRRALAVTAKALIATGSESQIYLEKIGVNRTKILNIKLAIDMTPFHLRMDERTRIELRKNMLISGLCYLYVGQLTNMKGVQFLVDAWDIFSADERSNATLVMIGNGEQKESLKKEVVEKGLSNVRFVPFVQPDELPQYYELADIFVFPTLGDVWGVVINEALASGLPVICSKYAGCASDLIVEGLNGWIVDPSSLQDLTGILWKAWESRANARTMGIAGKALISEINVRRMTDEINRAVEYALKK
jgi:glycosyltransferase involved in cell wall biosynthesis